MWANSPDFMQCLYVDSVPNNLLVGIKNLGQDTKYGSSFIVMTLLAAVLSLRSWGLSVTQRATPHCRTDPGTLLRSHLYLCPFRSQTATN